MINLIRVCSILIFILKANSLFAKEISYFELPGKKITALMGKTTSGDMYGYYTDDNGDNYSWEHFFAKINGVEYSEESFQLKSVESIINKINNNGIAIGHMWNTYKKNDENSIEEFGTSFIIENGKFKTFDCFGIPNESPDELNNSAIISINDNNTLLVRCTTVGVVKYYFVDGQSYRYISDLPEKYNGIKAEYYPIDFNKNEEILGSVQYLEGEGENVKLRQFSFKFKNNKIEYLYGPSELVSKDFIFDAGSINNAGFIAGRFYNDKTDERGYAFILEPNGRFHSYGEADLNGGFNTDQFFSFFLGNISDDNEFCGFVYGINGDSRKSLSFILKP